MPERGTNPRSPTFQTGSLNHCTEAPGQKESNIADPGHTLIQQCVNNSWFKESLAILWSQELCLKSRKVESVLFSLLQLGVRFGGTIPLCQVLRLGGRSTIPLCQVFVGEVDLPRIQIITRVLGFFISCAQPPGSYPPPPPQLRAPRAMLPPFQPTRRALECAAAIRGWLFFWIDELVSGFLIYTDN